MWEQNQKYDSLPCASIHLHVYGAEGQCKCVCALIIADRFYLLSSSNTNQLTSHPSWPGQIPTLSDETRLNLAEFCMHARQWKGQLLITLYAKFMYPILFLQDWQYNIQSNNEANKDRTQKNESYANGRIWIFESNLLNRYSISKYAFSQSFIQARWLKFNFDPCLKVLVHVHLCLYSDDCDVFQCFTTMIRLQNTKLCSVIQTSDVKGKCARQENVLPHTCPCDCVNCTYCKHIGPLNKKIWIYMKCIKWK